MCGFWSTFCKQPPVGYETETKYKNEFVKTGGGYHGALKALQTELQQASVNNIGLIVDADFGKAQLHTWLAWKSEPGKPFGVAVKSNYFDLNTPAVQSFIDWFSATFELS